MLFESLKRSSRLKKRARVLVNISSKVMITLIIAARQLRTLRIIAKIREVKAS
jgi:hypothetical protein